MSKHVVLPDRTAAVRLHQRLLRASPGKVVTPATAAAFAETLAQDPQQLRETWDVLGPWALSQLDRVLLSESEGNGATPRPWPGGGQIIAPKQPASWYQRLPLWKRPIAIGATGRQKALGELTHGDCQTIAQSYGLAATALREKADRWSAISRSVQGPETLGNAQHKLAQATLEFLRDETGGEVGHD